MQRAAIPTSIYSRKLALISIFNGSRRNGDEEDRDPFHRDSGVTADDLTSRSGLAG